MTHLGTQSTERYQDFEFVAASPYAYDPGEVLHAFRRGNLAVASALFRNDGSAELAAQADHAVARWGDTVEVLGTVVAGRAAAETEAWKMNDRWDADYAAAEIEARRINDQIDAGRPLGELSE